VPRTLGAVISGWAGVTRDGSIGGNGSAPGGSGSDAGGGRRALALAMSRWAGVMRDREGLAELDAMIAAAERAVGGGRAFATGPQTRAGWQEAACVPSGGLDVCLELAAVEAANLRVVSGLIAAGALRRAESRGCHRRRDAVGTAERPWHTLSRWDGQELAMAEEEL
jgi:L-aspartate oxidase